MKQYLTWGVLSAFLVFVSHAAYMWGVYKKTIPHPPISTWGMWTMIALLIVLTYKDTGATMNTTLPVAWVCFLDNLIILLLVLRYGELSWSKLETRCTIMFIITMIVWKTSNNPLVGLIGGIIADAMGLIPQIRQAWKNPEEESCFSWTTLCLAGAIGLPSVEKWEFGYYAFPVYITLAGGLVAFPLLRHRLKLRPL